MLLKTSDPVINSHREVPSKRTGNLPLEVLNLIVPPLIPAHQVASKILCDDEDYLGPIRWIFKTTTIHQMIIVEYIFVNSALSPKL